MAKTATPPAPEPMPSRPGILHRFKTMFMGGNATTTNDTPDWTELVQRCKGGDEDAVLDWCLTNGLSPVTAQIACVAIQERERLIPIHAAGEHANERLGPAQAELSSLRRCAVSSLAGAEELAHKQAKLEMEIARLNNDIAEGYAAGMWLRHINEQFSELFGLPPARVCQGTASAAIHEVFQTANCNPYALHSWKISLNDAAASIVQPELKPRQRIQSHSQN